MQKEISDFITVRIKSGCVVWVYVKIIRTSVNVTSNEI